MNFKNQSEANEWIEISEDRILQIKPEMILSACQKLDETAVCEIKLDKIETWTNQFNNATTTTLTPYLLRGICNPLIDDEVEPDWLFVWLNTKTNDVWIQCLTSRPEILLPGQVWKLYKYPIIVLLRSSPNSVSSTSHLGGDTFFYKPSKRIAFITGYKDY